MTTVLHDGQQPVEEEESQRLTMSLIAACTGRSGNANSSSPEERADELLNAEVLRLDWQRIANIENLDSFTHVRELYLQHNNIEVIEELDTLINLEFLALGSNRIRRLQNLRHLKKLQVLDLSSNEIQDVDTQEIPRSLVILNLAENPCCKGGRGFQQKIVSALPELLELDRNPVNRQCQQHGFEACKGEPGPDVGVEKPRLGHDLTLYVTVETAGVSRVVPLYFNNSDDLHQRAKEFCVAYALHGQGPEDTICQEMENAVQRSARVDSRDRRAPEQPEGEEDILMGTGGDRIDAILNLQQAGERVLEESLASFHQHKNHILSITRKAIERKTAAARGRSDALDNDINKVLDDARSTLRQRKERVQEENRLFAADMRQRAERAFAQRRRESEAVTTAAVHAPRVESVVESVVSTGC